MFVCVCVCVCVCCVCVCVVFVCVLCLCVCWRVILTQSQIAKGRKKLFSRINLINKMSTKSLVASRRVKIYIGGKEVRPEPPNHARDFDEIEALLREIEVLDLSIKAMVKERVVPRKPKAQREKRDREKKKGLYNSYNSNNDISDCDCEYWDYVWHPCSKHKSPPTPTEATITPSTITITRTRPPLTTSTTRLSLSSLARLRPVRLTLARLRPTTTATTKLPSPSLLSLRLEVKRLQEVHHLNNT